MCGQDESSILDKEERKNNIDTYDDELLVSVSSFVVNPAFSSNIVQRFSISVVKLEAIYNI